MTGAIRLNVSRRHVLVAGAALLAIELILEALFAAPLPSYTVQMWFDLNGEANIPSWFSSTQLFAVAALAAYAALAECAAWRAPLSRSGWWLASAIFLYLSLDEAAQLHEAVGEQVSKHVTIGALQENVYYWLPAFLPAIVFGGLYLAVFLWSRFRSRPRLLLLAALGLACWLLVPLSELLDGVTRLSRGWRHVAWGFEELLEMVGATYFFVAVLRYATTVEARRP